MRYISIDIETSGLNPDRNQVLSIGAIIEDTNKKLKREECPTFYKIISHREITGNPYALNLNREEIEMISKSQKSKEDDAYSNWVCKVCIEEDMVAKEFFDFLFENGFYERVFNEGDPNTRVKNDTIYPIFDNTIKPIKFTVAGKNFGTFDKIFLEKLPWWQRLFRIKQRILDPSILYIDWENDTEIPNLALCKKRAGIDGVVTHNALDDAWDVVELLRKTY